MVHLNSDAVAAIESLRRPILRASDPVFPRQGKSFDTRSWFHPCLEDAGIIGYVWHSNQHTFCSWLAMAAVGHKSIIMSARYSHLSPAHKLSVVERIASASE